MPSPWNNPRGSITLVALCLAVVIGISLASYLAVCQQSLLLSTRTVQLGKARQLAETGLEEALWSLNAYVNPSSAVAATAWTSVSSTTPTVSALNVPWTTSGNNKSCTIDGYNLGNNATGKLEITITYYDGPKAAVTAPTAVAEVPAPTITATATVTVPGTGDIKRTLTAVVRPAPLFANALAVVDGSPSVPSIILPAGTVIDSWDSDYNPAAIAPTPYRDYNVSTARVLYSVSPPGYTAAANCAAVVAAPVITLNGDATIYGYVATLGSAINTTVSCLIKGPTTPALTKIDQSRVSKSAFIPNFVIQAPLTSIGTWQNLPSTAARGGGTYTIGTPSGPTEYWAASADEAGMYYASNGGNDLFLTGSQILRINGPVVLVVQEDFQISGNAQIEITSTGRLEIYVRDDVYITSPIAFLNNTKEPKNLALFCTKEASSDIGFTFDTPQRFDGVIFYDDRSSTSITLNSPTIYGALLAVKNITFSGVPTIHYDTALQYLPKSWFKGVTTPFMITQVTETP